MNIRGQCLKSYNSLGMSFGENCRVFCVPLGRENLQNDLFIFFKVFFFFFKMTILYLSILLEFY